tara:strand:- start:226 stop:504 length:279 start_codon:yes stop_codon:yes gene_type:complete
MVDSISLEQLNEQQQQLLQTVNNFISQKAQLEEQLENCKATLASNQGALQYANALIQSCTEDADVDSVGDGNVAEEINSAVVEEVEAEAVEL